jgi:hypothetical protein
MKNGITIGMREVVEEEENGGLWESYSESRKYALFY